MDWNAQNYHATCGRVTEHGAKLVDVLRPLTRGRVLDVGCGTGTLTKEIAGFAAEVVGIDASPAMIEKARATYPELEFAVMDACALAFDGRFDAVFSNAVFHFIKDQDALLGGVHRALTPGGILVCEFGAAGNLAGLLNAVERACVRRGKDYALRFYYPAEDEYRRLLEMNGFVVESIVTYDLDTRLTEGAPGLRNWVNQIFGVEMSWFDGAGRDGALTEIEDALRPVAWDGENWHLANRRLRVIARRGRAVASDH